MIDGTLDRAVDPMTQPFRIETDSLGGIEVMSEALWGAQTQRSLQNFATANGSRLKSSRPWPGSSAPAPRCASEPTTG